MILTPNIYVTIDQTKSSVYITGNEGPENEPRHVAWNICLANAQSAEVSCVMDSKRQANVPMFLHATEEQAAKMQEDRKARQRPKYP